ncbi:PI-PLC domain-containing protein [Kutzneria albida]|uniref:Ricin B lectin domain-containing protein n=1 Tax=Kutzneria albida DSM 43870 TaxID=1449976 RepID=W5W4L7_9PSEU|nr:PI-PLC domain-containing protein [Kutzneria albida]AHH95421.1 hypothetical protein KALB_2052 [Kutzneria albida DSM 43870]
MRASRLATASLLIVATALSTPAPATAAPADGQYYLQSADTGLNAADSGGTIAAHRPKGNEDHQQWVLRSSGDTVTLSNADESNACLGRSGGKAVRLACDSPDARWTLAEGYTLRAPGTDSYLRADLTLGAAARWYLTPVTARTAPMPADPRLDQVTFLTAHNAFANGVDGGFAPPFVNLFPNQNRGISQQLADGVRGFMMDIYQTPDGAILCHTSCTLVSKPVALWVDVQRVVDFLRQHPDQFVTIFLEDYVDAALLRSELARVNGLADLLYRPDRTGVRQNGWPTLSSLVAANQRLMIFTDHDRGSDSVARDSFGVMYQREWTVENYWSMGSGVGNSDWSCYSRWSEIPLTADQSPFHPLFVMNHFRDTPMSGTISTDNGKLLDRAQRFCQPAARKKPTYLAVDRYDLSNPMSAVTALNGYLYTP